ncbi:hypothetical protein [Halpernia frigidisoli]|uniref:Uncharacterized protein n=1 Tax=Halpernia frigidisoli TaxID=1125876 RepID=A0A1I3DZC5_9FLAO|nr:hypothetical protein [Halpernia frigidisoli]SFH92066.1 hypothetical protein SAMN05443292_0789 [Halpernia frigidisoli]
MKKILQVILLFICFLSFKAQTNEDLIGKWQGVDSTKNIWSITFSKDNFISFSINGEFIDGKNFKIHGGSNDGKFGQVIYKVDFKSNPIKINLIAKFKKGDLIIEKGILKGFLKFVNKNEILILLDFENKNYTNFTEENKNDTARLIRSEE